MKRHLGSTLSFLFGIMILFAGLADHKITNIPGIIIILGALAYRSAKKRKLGEVKSSKTRKIMEGFAIAIIFYIVLSQKHIFDKIYDDPLYFLIIPIWAIIAYVWVNMSKTKWLIFADREVKVK